MNKFKSASNVISHLIIILSNAIPLLGYFLLKWNIKELFLFYSLEVAIYEIIMLPRIVIFAFISGENEGKNLFMKIITSFFIIFYHISLFVLALWFMIHSAFAISAASAEVSISFIISFLKFNILIVILICADYVYGFYRDYIKIKEYKILSTEFYEIEIYLFYILLITAIGLINGAGVFLKLTADIYQFVMFILIIVLKTAAQILMKKRKDIEYFKKKDCR
jgi:hypothetical protein